MAQKFRYTGLSRRSESFNVLPVAKSVKVKSGAATPSLISAASALDIIVKVFCLVCREEVFVLREVSKAEIATRDRATKKLVKIFFMMNLQKL